jgi:endothelin-converting enzyme/putative endopeptidase
MKRSLTLLLCIAAFAAVANAQVDTSRPPATFSDYPADQALNACTDFHTYACATWEKTHPIPPDRAGWGTFSIVGEWNRATLHNILEDTAKPGGARNEIDRKVGDYYASCMDEAAIEKRGLAAIKPEIARIKALKSKKDLAPLLAHVHLITGNLNPGGNSGATTAVFGYGSIPDFDNAAMIVGAIDQGGLGLPDRDYYFRSDAKSKEQREAYLALIRKMLRLAGESEQQATAGALNVMSMETLLAEHSMEIVKRRDPANINHKMTLADLEKAAPSFDWKAYFAALKSPKPDHYIVLHPEFISEVDTLIRTLPLADWKTYLEWHLLNQSANELPKAFAEASFEFYGKTLAGRKELPARWKRCADDADRDLGEPVGRAYVARAFPPSSKERMLNLVHALEQALDEDIAGLDWMSDTTKQQAHVKLKAILDKIGYPDKWRDYSPLVIKRGDFLGNSYRASAFEANHDIQKIGKPRSRMEWGMTPPTVNAYYSPLTNTINFPAGILQPPFFDASADDAVNFGGIGVVIGHELTHGFDDQGRKFDAEGNLRDWWTADDAKKFEERAKCISDEYSGFVAVDDVHVNGQLTLGENTADNGGIRIALRALHNVLKAQGKENDVINGLTPDQRFFLAFAHVWCSNLSPQILRLIAQTDPHSPGTFRINGTVANMPEFRDAFGCKVTDAMVREKGCKVW